MKNEISHQLQKLRCTLEVESWNEVVDSSRYNATLRELKYLDIVVNNITDIKELSKLVINKVTSRRLRVIIRKIIKENKDGVKLGQLSIDDLEMLSNIKSVDDLIGYKLLGRLKDFNGYELFNPQILLYGRIFDGLINTVAVSLHYNNNVKIEFINVYCEEAISKYTESKLLEGKGQVV